MQYLSNLFVYILFVAIVVFAGFQLWKGIGKGSESRRYHGKFVLIGSMIGYGIPTLCLFPLLLADFNASIDTKISLAPMVGLLIGWAIGMVVGAIALLSRNKDSEESQKSKVLGKEMVTQQVPSPE